MLPAGGGWLNAEGANVNDQQGTLRRTKRVSTDFYHRSPRGAVGRTRLSKACKGERTGKGNTSSDSTATYAMPGQGCVSRRRSRANEGEKPWERRLERHLHSFFPSVRSHSHPSHRMWANVLRVSGKQGTGTLIISSSGRTRLRLSPRPPLPTTTFASHGRRLAPFSPPFSIRRFTSARVVSDGPSSSHSQTQTTTSFEDPSRKGLFYHLVPPPTPLSDSRPAFAVSLLADPPPSSESSTVLGWLPAETPGDDRGAGLNDFVENRACIPHSPPITLP